MDNYHVWRFLEEHRLISRSIRQSDVGEIIKVHTGLHLARSEAEPLRSGCFPHRKGSHEHKVFTVRVRTFLADTAWCEEARVPRF